MALFSDILLTVDYDRTLTAPDSTIPKRNLEAIRYFIENGGAFTVNTGRSIPMARVFMDQVEVNAPFLLYNGSAAYDKELGKLIFAHEIQLDPWETAAKCQELFPGLPFEIQGLNAHYCVQENPAWDAFCDHQPCAHALAQPGDDIGPFLKFTLYGKIRDVTVSDLFHCLPGEMEQLNQVETTLKEVFGDHCEVFRSANRIIDIHAKGVSKGRSARQLLQTMGRKILVCAGDGHNDLPMMEEADFAFTPADSAIAEQYKNVCCCGDGAVAEVIYKKIPEILEKMA